MKKWGLESVITNAHHWYPVIVETFFYMVQLCIKESLWMLPFKKKNVCSHFFVFFCVFSFVLYMSFSIPSAALTGFNVYALILNVKSCNKGQYSLGLKIADRLSDIQQRNSFDFPIILPKYVLPRGV